MGKGNQPLPFNKPPNRSLIVLTKSSLIRTLASHTALANSYITGIADLASVAFDRHVISFHVRSPASLR